ncbi:MAG: FAD-dependent monooxygenase [Thermoleophilaceae bacterium]|nr:FAD-dependent monooxygenase [Thermoleophilaceae bacterium]
MAARERFDLVVIGARCAGSAVAIAAARAGRTVLAVDRSAFPSDTLSTHANFPSAVAEMQALGALERIKRAGPPECREAMVSVGSIATIARWIPVDGIDYALCNPREEFDQALVETAREAGAEVRERTSLVDVLWRDGRASGVRLKDGSREYEVDCGLVVGADGRRSMTAYRVGADRPYRGSRNGRGLAFFYCDDPQVGRPGQNRMAQHRAGRTHTLVFPCPGDRMLALFMGPAEEIPDFRRDPMGMWDKMLAENPIAAARVAGATNHTKLRSTGSVSAFFRRSSGPGWALTGDAGHFKDPVIGQGMRDALRFGRLLGEGAATALDDPVRLDTTLIEAERRRDRECLASYHWGNRESRAVEPSDLVRHALRSWGLTGEPAMAEMFDRRRAPHRIMNPLVGTRFALGAALRSETDRRALAAEVLDTLRTDIAIWREDLTQPFRSERRLRSEWPDYDWPSAAPAEVSRPEVTADADALEQSIEAVAG